MILVNFVQIFIYYYLRASAYMQLCNFEGYIAFGTVSCYILTFLKIPGVTRQVGDALQLERSQRAGRVVSIGIAPWGIVEGAHELIGRGRDVPYHAMASPRYLRR